MNTMRASTLRRLTTGAVLAAALLAGQAQAAIMEEVVAHGTMRVAAAQQAHFEAEMASYVRTVQLELRAFVRQSLEQSAAPQLQLTPTTASNRG